MSKYVDYTSFRVQKSNHCFFTGNNRVREVPGSIPSQGPRHTKDVIKMVPVVTLKREILALSQELR